MLVIAPLDGKTRKISSLIQEFFQLRKEAEELIENAKEKVEGMILG